VVWCEIARPQVHGYDIVGVVFIDPLKFVSISDEKAARVFAAPSGFIRTAESLQVAQFAENEVSDHL
jgi:elongator complex protein 2